MTDRDARDDEDGWGDPPLIPRPGLPERRPRQGVNRLAVATLTALVAWVTAMFFAGWYAHSVGYPPISLDREVDFIAPTDVQNRVRGAWGVLEMLSLPVALVAVALSGAALASPRERVSAAIALAVSIVSVAVAFVVAVFGLVDFVFRQ